MKDLLSLQTFFAVFKHVGRYLFNPINRLFCIAQPYIEPSRASGYGGCAGLRVDFCNCALFCVGQTA